MILVTVVDIAVDNRSTNNCVSLSSMVPHRNNSRNILKTSQLKGAFEFTYFIKQWTSSSSLSFMMNARHHVYHIKLQDKPDQTLPAVNA